MVSEALREHVHAGDWACAHANDAGLARAATGLSGRLQLRALSVAAAALADMADAMQRWAELTDELRATAGAPAQASVRSIRLIPFRSSTSRISVVAGGWPGREWKRNTTSMR